MPLLEKGRRFLDGARQPLAIVPRIEDHHRALFLARLMKTLHHRVPVGIHGKHGKGEHFTAVRAPPLAVNAGDPHRHTARLLNAPALGFA